MEERDPQPSFFSCPIPSPTLGRSLSQALVVGWSLLSVSAFQNTHVLKAFGSKSRDLCLASSFVDTLLSQECLATF